MSKKETYPWDNVAVYQTYQEAFDERKRILNEDVMARLKVKISKQAKGFVVKTRTRRERQGGKKEEN